MSEEGESFVWENLKAVCGKLESFKYNIPNELKFHSCNKKLN